MSTLDILKYDSKWNAYAFIKLLSEESHAKNFLSGNLYFNPIENYIPNSSNESDFLYDSIEGSNYLNYIKSLTINGREFKTVPPSPGCDPNSFDTGEYEFSHILSMSCISDIPTKARFEGKVIDESLFNFGNHVVVVFNKAEFIRRFTAEFEKRSFPHAWGDIHYVESHYSGVMNTFLKVKEHHGVNYYAQQEWRIASQINHSGTFILSIGDLSDIAMYIPRSKIKNMIRLLPGGGYSIDF